MRRINGLSYGVRPCNFNDFYYFRNALSDEMIEDVHKMVYDNNYKFEKGGTGYAEGGGIDHNNSNNRDIAYIPWVEHSNMIYTFLEGPREKGDILIFPTFYLHRVTPITKGERRALVFWTGGEPFR